MIHPGIGGALAMQGRGGKVSPPSESYNFNLFAFSRSDQYLGLRSSFLTETFAQS